jgi:amino acid transporter
VVFVPLVALIAPLVGKAIFIPLVDCISFAYIILWSSTFFLVLRMKKTYPDLERPIKMPGGKWVAYLGTAGTLFMIFVLL